MTAQETIDEVLDIDSKRQEIGISDNDMTELAITAPKLARMLRRTLVFCEVFGYKAEYEALRIELDQIAREEK